MGAQQMLMGVGGDRLTLNADIVSATDPGTAVSQWRIAADGGVYWSRTNVSGGAFIFQYNWIEPPANAANYECTWTAGAGTVDTTPGAAGTWLACTVNRDWAESNAIGFESATFTARIRRVGGTEETTALISLDVDGS